MKTYNTSSFYNSLFQAVHGVMSLPLYPQLVPQAPQHSRSLIKMWATCDVLALPDVIAFVPTVSASGSSTLKILDQDASHLWWLVMPTSVSTWSFPSTLACTGQPSHRSLQRWMSNIARLACLHFQFHFVLSLATPLNPWGWRHIGSDSCLWRWSSREHA